jgi:hypothetical protein
MTCIKELISERSIAYDQDEESIRSPRRFMWSTRRPFPCCFVRRVPHAVGSATDTSCCFRPSHLCAALRRLSWRHRGRERAGCGVAVS